MNWETKVINIAKQHGWDMKAEQRFYVSLPGSVTPLGQE